MEPGHPMLHKYLEVSFPPAVLRQLDYAAPRGRLDPESLHWWDRLVLKISASLERDRSARERVTKGYDYLDRISLKPIWELVGKCYEQKQISRDPVSYESLVLSH